MSLIFKLAFIPFQHPCTNTNSYLPVSTTAQHTCNTHINKYEQGKVKQKK